MPKASGTKLSQISIPTNISAGEQTELIASVRERFEANMFRHQLVRWFDVEEKLLNDNKKLLSLFAMEQTGGEPDVIGYDDRYQEYLICDCSAQSPQRRSTCYDRAAEQKRIDKGVFPAGNAVDLAREMGIDLLTEAEYGQLQELVEFDTKTSSWLLTPPEVRKLGGAIFGDRRYNRVFTYHNGADSFYEARGFRGMLRV